MKDPDLVEMTSRLYCAPNIDSVKICLPCKSNARQVDIDIVNI
jgi:hypothetical protein